MANINSVITYNANLSAAQAQVKALTGNIAGLTVAFNALDKAALKAQRSAAGAFATNVGQIGGFTTQTVKATGAVESFGKQLASNKLTMREYFREAITGYTRQGSLMRQLAEQQVRYQQSVAVPMGGGQAMMLTPQSINATSNATQLASQRFSVFNQLVNGGATSMLNWGKNTQWAGRQLMVGFTLPLALFAGVMSKQFRDLDRELTRFQKVYGADLGNAVSESTQRMRDQIQQLAYDISSAYGIAAKETAALAADIAATGREGAELIGSIQQTTRLAVLGEVDRQEAMKATLSLQSAFRMNTDELAESINFLNAVENQTSATLEDLTTAIPKVGPVVRALGGDVKDLAALLVAMREGGIPAAEAANALKSGLAALINPTKQASLVAKQFGVNLVGIVEANKGQLMPTIYAMQDALSGLDSFSRSKIIEQVFGKYQFARITALFDNIGRVGSQTQAVLELAGKSSAELAAVANAEIKTLTESTAVKFQRTLENLKNSLMPIAETLTETLIPVLETIGKGISMFSTFFSSLPDGVKNVAKWGVALTALAGPVIMLVGLFGNLIANGIKFGMMIVRIGASMSGMKVERFQLLDENVMAAKLGIDNLTRSFTTQESAMTRLVVALSAYEKSLKRIAVTNPNLFIPGAVPITRGVAPIRRQAGSTAPEKVPGGYGGGDRIPALLEPGESVITKEATAKFWPVIEAMNRGNLPGFNRGTIFLGMPRGYKDIQGAKQVKQTLSNTNIEATTGRFAKLPVTDIGERITSIGGRSSSIPGVNGIYEQGGKKYVVKTHDTADSALAEVRGTQLTRDVFGLETPVQELIKIKHPRTGDIIFAARSPYDTKFANSTGVIDEKNFFGQSLAAVVRRDKDLQPDNLYGNIVTDVGQAFVANKASQPRIIGGELPSVSEQIAANFLMSKGGAKKWFAENTAPMAKRMSEDAYVKGFQTTIAEASRKARGAIDNLPFMTKEERVMYSRIIDDLDEAAKVDWRAVYQFHRGITPDVKKPPTAAALAKKEALDAERARQRGDMARWEYGIPLTFSEGGKVPGGYGGGDKVPAYLEPGEFVITKEATKLNKSFLETINSGKNPGRYKEGKSDPPQGYSKTHTETPEELSTRLKGAGLLPKNSPSHAVVADYGGLTSTLGATAVNNQFYQISKNPPPGYKSWMAPGIPTSQKSAEEMLKVLEEDLKIRENAGRPTKGSKEAISEIKKVINDPDILKKTIRSYVATTVGAERRVGLIKPKDVQAREDELYKVLIKKIGRRTSPTSVLPIFKQLPVDYLSELKEGKIPFTNRKATDSLGKRLPLSRFIFTGPTSTETKSLAQSLGRTTGRIKPPTYSQAKSLYQRIQSTMMSMRGLSSGGEGRGEAALLEPGEFVVNSKASAQYAPVLREMNKGTLKGYQYGRTGETTTPSGLIIPASAAPAAAPTGGAVGPTAKSHLARPIQVPAHALAMIPGLTAEVQVILQQLIANGGGLVRVFNNLVVALQQTTNSALSTGTAMASTVSSELKSAAAWDIIMNNTGLDMQELQPVINAVTTQLDLLGNELIDDPRLYQIVETQLQELGMAGDRAAAVLQTLSNQYGVMADPSGRQHRMNLGAGAGPSYRVARTGTGAPIQTMPYFPIGQYAVSGSGSGTGPTVAPSGATRTPLPINDANITGPRAGMKDPMAKMMRGQGLMNVGFMGSMLVSSFAMAGQASEELASKLNMLSMVLMTLPMLSMLSGKGAMTNFLGLKSLGSKLSAAGLAKQAAAIKASPAAAMLPSKAMISGPNIPVAGRRVFEVGSNGVANATRVGSGIGAAPAASRAGMGLLTAGRALSFLGGPPGIALALGITGVVTAYMLYQKAADEARERAIASFEDPAKSAEYFGEAIDDLSQELENRSGRFKIGDMVDIDPELRKIVGEEYAPLIDRLKYSQAEDGARELSLAYNNMLINGLSAENARETLKAIAAEAGTQGGVAYTQAFTTSMLTAKSVEEALQKQMNLLNPENNKDLIEKLQGQLPALESRADTTYAADTAQSWAQLGKGIIQASPLTGWIDPDKQKSSWYDFFGQIEVGITGLGNIWTSVTSQMFDSTPEARAADAARNAVDQAKTSIEALANLSADSFNAATTDFMKAYEDAPRQVLDNIATAATWVEATDDNLQIMKEGLIELNPILEGLINTLETPAEIGIFKQLLTIGLDPMMYFDENGFNQALASAAVLTMGYYDELEGRNKESFDELKENTIDFIDEEIKSVNKGIRKINDYWDSWAKVTRKEQRQAQEDYDKAQRRSEKFIEGKQDEVEAIEDTMDVRRDEFDDKMQALQDEKDLIEESTDKYIESLTKRKEADSFYAQQRETSLGALQKLASGDVFGFLQDREQMSSDAQDFSYDQMISGIEDRRDLEVDAIDETMEKERRRQEEWEDAQRDKIDGINDLMEAERDLMEERTKAHEKDLRQFEKRQETIQTNRNQDLKSERIKLKDLAQAREKAESTELSDYEELSKLLGEEYKKRYDKQIYQLQREQFFIRYNTELYKEQAAIASDLEYKQRSDSEIVRTAFTGAFGNAPGPAQGGALGMSIEDILRQMGIDPSNPQITLNDPDARRPGEGAPTAATGGYINNGQVQRFQNGGGKVTGPGGPKSDVIPAMLSNGEYVVQASSVKKYGTDLMHTINAAKYADGGIIKAGNGVYVSADRAEATANTNVKDFEKRVNLNNNPKPKPATTYYGGTPTSTTTPRVIPWNTSANLTDWFKTPNDKYKAKGKYSGRNYSPYATEGRDSAFGNGYSGGKKWQENMSRLTNFGLNTPAFFDQWRDLRRWEKEQFIRSFKDVSINQPPPTIIRDSVGSPASAHNTDINAEQHHNNWWTNYESKAKAYVRSLPGGADKWMIEHFNDTDGHHSYRVVPRVADNRPWWQKMFIPAYDDGAGHLKGLYDDDGIRWPDKGDKGTAVDYGWANGGIVQRFSGGGGPVYEDPSVLAAAERAKAAARAAAQKKQKTVYSGGTPTSAYAVPAQNWSPTNSAYAYTKTDRESTPNWDPSKFNLPPQSLTPYGLGRMPGARAGMSSPWNLASPYVSRKELSQFPATADRLDSLSHLSSHKLDFYSTDSERLKAFLEQKNIRRTGGQSGALRTVARSGTKWAEITKLINSTPEVKEKLASVARDVPDLTYWRTLSREQKQWMLDYANSSSPSANLQGSLGKASSLLNSAALAISDSAYRRAFESNAYESTQQYYGDYPVTGPAGGAVGPAADGRNSQWVDPRELSAIIRYRRRNARLASSSINEHPILTSMNNALDSFSLPPEPYDGGSWTGNKPFRLMPWLPEETGKVIERGLPGKLRVPMDRGAIPYEVPWWLSQPHDFLPPGSSPYPVYPGRPGDAYTGEDVAPPVGTRVVSDMLGWFSQLFNKFTTGTDPEIEYWNDPYRGLVPRPTGYADGGIVQKFDSGGIAGSGNRGGRGTSGGTTSTPHSGSQPYYSQNGWPYISNYGVAPLSSGKIPGSSVSLSTHRDALPLFLALASEYNKKIRRVDGSQSAGFGFRDNRTNHRSGTAVDINWSEEGALSDSPALHDWWAGKKSPSAPWSSLSSNPAQTAVQIRDNFNKFGKIIEWYGSSKLGGDLIYGGGYTSDWMHWQIDQNTKPTPERIKEITSRLGIAPDGTFTGEATTGTPDGTPGAPGEKPSRPEKRMPRMGLASILNKVGSVEAGEGDTPTTTTTTTGNVETGSGGDWLRSFIASKGISGEVAKTLWAIGMKESGGDPGKLYPQRSSYNWDSSGFPKFDTGTFQINNIHLDKVKNAFGSNATMQDMLDPQKNWTIMEQLSSNFTKWNPWGIAADMVSPDWTGWPATTWSKEESFNRYMSYRNQFADGGMVKMFATGGKVRGPGGPRSDKIPAMLSNGEYVVKASSVAKYGKGFMDQVNSGHLNLGGGGMAAARYANGGMIGPAKFADGGFVGSMASAPSPTFGMPQMQSVSPADISANNNSSFNAGNSSSSINSSNVKVIINGSSGKSSRAIANRVISIINEANGRRNHSRSI